MERAPGHLEKRSNRIQATLSVPSYLELEAVAGNAEWFGTHCRAPTVQQPTNGSGVNLGALFKGKKRSQRCCRRKPGDHPLGADSEW